MMRIGEVARHAGVSCDTLRFYEKRGLIKSTRGSNGYRRYAAETAQLVGWIRTAQHMGFTLAEIGASMPSVWNAPDTDAAVAALLVQKISSIDARIAELVEFKTALLTRARQSCPLARDGESLPLAMPAR